MPRWNPPWDVSEFGGSQTEQKRFHDQRYARLAREAFATDGRGVQIIHVDRTAQTLRHEYNTMTTDDGSDIARQVRALVETYDPARQAVILYRDPAVGRDVPLIVNIDAQH